MKSLLCLEVNFCTETVIAVSNFSAISEEKHFWCISKVRQKEYSNLRCVHHPVPLQRDCSVDKEARGSCEANMPREASSGAEVFSTTVLSQPSADGREGSGVWDH